MTTKLYRVYDNTDEQIWAHILLDKNGNYKQELEGDEDLEHELTNLMMDYVDTLSAEEAKKYVDIYGEKNAIQLFESVFGDLDTDDEQGLYQALVHIILAEDVFEVREYNP